MVSRVYGCKRHHWLILKAVSLIDTAFLEVNPNLATSQTEHDLRVIQGLSVDLSPGSQSQASQLAHGTALALNSKVQVLND